MKNKVLPGQVTDSGSQEEMTPVEVYAHHRAGAAASGSIVGNATMFGGGASGAVVEGPHAAGYRIATGGAPIPVPGSVIIDEDDVVTDMNGDTVTVPE
jgi:hypothetical protein